MIALIALTPPDGSASIQNLTGKKSGDSDPEVAGAEGVSSHRGTPHTRHPSRAVHASGGSFILYVLLSAVSFGTQLHRIFAVHVFHI